MRTERRNHLARAETLKRVTHWISRETLPAQQVPSEIAASDVGRRILTRLALRGLVRHTDAGWVAQRILTAPVALKRIEIERENRSGVERRGDLPTLRCRRCHRSGVVRHENVVRGVVAERQFFCGICGYGWTVKDRRSKWSAPPPRDRADDRSQRL
jgi:hypothetical protein